MASVLLAVLLSKKSRNLRKMALIKTGIGVADLQGGVGGCYFHRDKSGLKVCTWPRVIRRRTTAQDLQRKAFTAARAFSHNPRTVSYNIYRFLNGLSMQTPPIDYQIPGM